MRIKWYGTASLLIESGNSRILIDPYLKEYNKKLPPVPVDGNFDAIFITHPHFDHFCDIGAFLKSGRKIYVSENGIMHARENGIPTEDMLPISANREITVGDISVRTYQSRHCKFDFATVLSVALNPVTYFHARKAVKLLKLNKNYRIGDDIYALEISSEGKNVIVLGSAGMADGVDYPQNADLMVFPYQGRSRMHRYLIPFLKVFRPKAVMIDHFDNAFPPLTHTVNTKKFIPTVKKILPSAKAFVPAEGEWYEV